MANITSPAVEAQGRQTPSSGRVPAAILRLLLGLMFLVFGLNGFLKFMPEPKDMPQEIMVVLSALTAAGYMAVVSGAELLVAVLLLTDCFVPLALGLVAPIIVGILTFHIALAPATIGPGIAVLLIELYLAWAYRAAFRPMLALKTQPGVS